jgi:hypothetical protein
MGISHLKLSFKFYRVRNKYPQNLTFNKKIFEVNMNKKKRKSC